MYGNRVVLFAPLYTSNYCSNSCSYCGFHGANAELERLASDDAEVRRETAALTREGHKRLVMLCGEHPRYPFEAFLRHV